MIKDIEQLRIQAMKDKDVLSKNIYSLLLGEIQTQQSRGVKPLEDKDILKIVRKLKTSCEENAKLNVEGADVEVEILDKLLPIYMSEDEVRRLIDKHEIINSDKPMSLIGPTIARLTADGASVESKVVADIFKSIIDENRKEVEEQIAKAYEEAGEDVPTEYHAYQHVEKLKSSATTGILEGTVYVFPKLDGTNAKVWLDGAGMHFGSRKRELSLDRDNGRFMEWCLNQPRLRECLEELNGKYTRVELFGEWLIRHTLKTYKEEAWRRFWVFDVYLPLEERYLTYEEYQPILAAHGLDYIPLMAKLDHPDQTTLLELANTNTFMIQEEKGCGEGIVMKNYDYKNKWGRIVWAKIVLSEFKGIHSSNKDKKNPPGDFLEQEMVDRFYTAEIAEKVLANLINENDGDWEGKLTGRLIQTCWYDFVNECIWEITKKFKNPKIDFKLLQNLVTQRTKEHLTDVF